MNFRCEEINAHKKNAKNYDLYFDEINKIYIEMNSRIEYYYEKIVRKQELSFIDDFHNFIENVVVISECVNFDRFKLKLYEIVKTIEFGSKTRIDNFYKIKFYDTDTKDNQILVGDYNKKNGEIVVN